MADISHRISIDAPTDDVFHAISTIDGLRGWWTDTTSGGSAPGDTIEFRFGDHRTDMKVEASEPASHVSWTCLGTAPQWTGTKVSFHLKSGKGKTSVNFGHRGWREADEFFSHCSTKWATFMLSLKQFVETGQGRPFPHDLPI